MYFQSVEPVGMKGFKIVLLFFCILLLAIGWVKADPVNKKNLGFEKGDFTGWTGYTWIYQTRPVNSTPKIEGIVNGRHTIMTDPNAFDPNTGGRLKIIPNGYKYSAKIGSTTRGGRHQSLSYTMKVDSSNALLVWKFAIVLEDPERNHEIWEEPRFKITLYDENGDTIDDCSNYDVYATDARIGGFNTYWPADSNSIVVWRDWTTVGANLLPYYGKTVTIEFLAADCTHRRHYGYGYFVVDCMPLNITVDFCADDVDAVLSAPSGFRDFKWKDIGGNVVDSVQNLLIQNPQEGDTYTCDMESETGCSLSLSAEIIRYEQEALFSSKMIDCFSNEVQLINESTHTNGSLSYLWDFGDGNTSEEKEPLYKFETSGMHRVRLILYNPPSGCTDTLYKDVESFSPPLVGFTGDSTYCPALETELTAYGAYRYEWNNGATSGSISVGDPGGKYWMLGYSTPEEGCVSDTNFVTIIEEPDWPFFITGDTFLCNGNNEFLRAIGAVDYLWDSGETIDSILVFQEGSYRVEGMNKRGCVKESGIKITGVPIPDLDFEISTHSINSRHNLLECSASSKDNNVNFKWDMGDGTVSNSPNLSYYYSGTNDLIVYNVDITATNEYGCSIKKRSYVEVEVFVPNVFTPNNDGVNDSFMPGYEIQVVDRHGIVMYNGQNGWDGFYKGQKADPDTYFYLLNYTDAYDENRVKKGYITLER